jgi:dTDP-4-amino-4,6-dideoxygalactose transaminase
VLGVYASRPDFHRVLRQRGIPATTWGEVVHPTLPLQEFPVSRKLYEQLIFLPVHQSLTANDLELIIDTVHATTY